MHTPHQDPSSHTSLFGTYGQDPVKATLSSDDSRSTEAPSPCSHNKRVTFVPSISNNKRQKAFDFKENKSCSKDSLFVTPIKNTPKLEVNAMKTASTIRKRQSLQDTSYISTSTVNRNRSSWKIWSSEKKDTEQNGSQKLDTIYGKRRFTDLNRNDDEQEHEAPNGRALRSLKFKDEEEKPAKTGSDTEETEVKIKKVINVGVVQRLKKAKTTEIEKLQPTYENMYLTTRDKLLCVPVFKDRDLKYNQDIQEKLKDIDVDNDCATDTEVLFSVGEVNKKDLFEGIWLHLKEKIDNKEIDPNDEEAKLADIRKAIWDGANMYEDDYSSDASLSGEVISTGIGKSTAL